LKIGFFFAQGNFSLAFCLIWASSKYHMDAFSGKLKNSDVIQQKRVMPFLQKKYGSSPNQLIRISIKIG
jgi:hypothetical protein